MAQGAVRGMVVMEVWVIVWVVSVTGRDLLTRRGERAGMGMQMRLTDCPEEVMVWTGIERQEQALLIREAVGYEKR